MNNCFLMLFHLKIHVILFMDNVVVMCSMLEINDDVLYCIVLICLDLRSTGNLSSYYKAWGLQNRRC